MPADFHLRLSILSLRSGPAPVPVLPHASPDVLALQLKAGGFHVEPTHPTFLQRAPQRQQACQCTGKRWPLQGQLQGCKAAQHMHGHHSDARVAGFLALPTVLSSGMGAPHPGTLQTAFLEAALWVLMMLRP